MLAIVSAVIVAKYDESREEVANLGVYSVGEDPSLLFAVLVAKRFHKVRQTREPTVLDRLLVLADICWIISHISSQHKVISPQQSTCSVYI